MTERTKLDHCECGCAILGHHFCPNCHADLRPTLYMVPCPNCGQHFPSGAEAYLAVCDCGQQFVVEGDRR